MASRKNKITLSLIIAAVLVLLLLVLLLIQFCPAQEESPVEQSESNKHEDIVPEKESEEEEIQEEIKKEEESVINEQEEPATEQKEKAPQEKVIMFDVDAGKTWQDSGITVTPEKHIIISYIEGKWTIDYNRNHYTGVGGYPGLNFTRDYPSITIGALIGKVGDGKAFKVGKRYEIKDSHISGNLYLRMNDLSGAIYDNRGSITVEIIEQQ